MERAADLVEIANTHSARGEFNTARTIAEAVLSRRIRLKKASEIRGIEARAAELVGWLDHNEGKYARACRLYRLAEDLTPLSDRRGARIAHLHLRTAQALGKIDPKQGLTALRKISQLGNGDLGYLLQAEYWRRLAEIQEDLIRGGQEKPERFKDLIELHDEKIIPQTIRVEAYDLAGNSEDNAARYETQLLEAGFRRNQSIIEKRFEKAGEHLKISTNINATYLHHLDTSRYLSLISDLDAAKRAYNDAVRLKIEFGLSGQPLEEASKRLTRKSGRRK
jgi:hypothetical protein